MARVARNETAFRELNEQLKRSLGGIRAESEAGTVGFICECGAGDCAKLVQISREKYEEVRGDSCLFFVAPGHELTEFEDVVEHDEGVTIVRKRDEAAEIVKATDPRS